MKRFIACSVVAGLTFTLYHATLLPGLDLGDTASFQASVGSSLISPRQGYPLYFAIGNLFARLDPDDPARALNLASAVCGALAAGAVAWVGIGLTGSALAGIGGGLLLGVSYTFWSQAIIAEVYALHLLLIGLSVGCLLAWANKPTMARLSVFFLVYAISFGNHQSMILLAPAFAWFIVRCSPGGVRSVLRPRVLLLAAGAIVVGLSQYLGSFRYLWYGADRPATWLGTLEAFWFDVTKSDWRQSMVLAVPSSMLGDRVGMFWFDLRQQFGATGVGLALVGIPFLRRTPARFELVAASYLVCTTFAFTYNVGDIHVFYLPSHLMTALSAACGIAWLSEAPSRWIRAPLWSSVVVSAAILGYPAWRAADTYAAVDRSRDTRAIELLDRLTTGLSASNAAYGADFDWQLQNGLDYYLKYRKPDLPCFSLGDALLRFPFLRESNEAIGREIVLSSGSADRLRAAFGSFYTLQIDSRLVVPRMIDFVDRLPRHTRYVFAFLAPARESPVDPATVKAISRSLIGAEASEFSGTGTYRVAAGAKGTRPVMLKVTDRPFRMTTTIGRDRTDIRMESWLPTETIRRAGFGHIIVNGMHAMTLERVLNLFVLGEDGVPSEVMYEASLFAPQPRFVLKPNRP